jgi:hypothetical protein
VSSTLISISYFHCLYINKLWLKLYLSISYKATYSLSKYRSGHGFDNSSLKNQIITIRTILV